ncbi:FxsA family protein [Rhizobium terrae]|uniref:FxsA family protein n=1 Tax=Rhizobium terrae TaxID=2171756 RepID=UPI000E3C0082|nr:FxsA family protein [Rhizobium terrae]
MRFFLVPIFLIGWPLAEIAGFVLVGRAVGLWATLGLVVGTAMLGAILLRSQGMHILRQISTESREGRVPGHALVDGAMIVVAGILLLLPGFLTDIVGLALFIPLVRRLIWSRIGRRVVVVRSASSRSYRYENKKPEPQQPGGPVVDLDEQDFHRDPNPPAPNRPSPWAGPNGREP